MNALGVFGFKPKTVVWKSGKMSADKAAARLAKERERRTRDGYVLDGQVWAPASRGLVSTVVKGAIFLPLAMTGGGKGELVATFRHES